LFDKFNLLVKDLTEKVGPRYIRLAVRDDEDNAELVVALSAMVALHQGEK
jgi:histidinol-phosphate/aromatic aminotransferase/cobyric acid decarboxylase-like protein